MEIQEVHIALCCESVIVIITSGEAQFVHSLLMTGKKIPILLASTILPPVHAVVLSPAYLNFGACLRMIAHIPESDSAA